MTEPGEARAARTLAAAWTDLEVGPLAGMLAAGVRYESPGVEMVLEGRSEVVAYLQRKMELIDLAGEDARIVASVVRMRYRGEDRWAVLSSQGSLARAALFVPTVDASGDIVSVEVVTEPEVLDAVSPPPGSIS